MIPIIFLASCAELQPSKQKNAAFENRMNSLVGVSTYDDILVLQGEIGSLAKGRQRIIRGHHFR